MNTTRNQKRIRKLMIRLLASRSHYSREFNRATRHDDPYAEGWSVSRRPDSDVGLEIPWS